MKIKTFSRVIAIILVIVMMFSVFTINVFAGGMDDGLYGPLATDKDAPYMVIVKTDTFYYAYKSATPIWYVYDENKLVVLEDGATIKKYRWTPTESSWKEQEVYMAILNENGVYNIDKNQNTTFLISDIMDVAGEIAGNVGDNTYGDNILNHNVKDYLEIEPSDMVSDTLKQKSEQVAYGLPISVLGLYAGDTPSAITHNLNLKTSGTIYDNINYTIEWQSNNGSILSNTGVVNRQNVDVNIQLTAIVKVNGASASEVGTRIFYLTVKGINETSEDIGRRILDNLSISDLNLVGEDTIDSVTKNFTPIRSKTETVQTGTDNIINTYDIKWTSSDETVLKVDSGNGEVVVFRPSFSQGDKYVDLTATIEGISGPSRYFRVKVPKLLDSTHELKVKAINGLNYSDINFAPNSNYMNIKEGFTLPNSIGGYTLTWSSDNTAINISGYNANVVRPSNLQPNAYVLLSAEIDGSIAPVNFYVRVLREDEDIDIKRNRIISNIDNDDFKMGLLDTDPVIDPESVASSFYVPIIIENEQVLWESSDPALSINETTGQVTVIRPNFGDGNKKVILTAKSIDSLYSNSFSFILKQKDESIEEYNQRLISGLGLAHIGNVDTTAVSSMFNISKWFNGQSIDWTFDGKSVSDTVDPTYSNGVVNLVGAIGGVSKTFKINVIDSGLNPQQKAQEQYNELAKNITNTINYNNIGLASNDSSISVTENINLPTKVYLYDSKIMAGETIPQGGISLGQISWESNESDVVSNDGTVIRDVEDKVVILTATFTPDSVRYDDDGDGVIDIDDPAITSLNPIDSDGDTIPDNVKSFSIIVRNTSYNPIEEDTITKVDRIISSIGVGRDSEGANIGIVLALGETMRGIKSNILLTDEYEGYPITWTTTIPSNIDTSTGVITRPTDGNNVFGTITAKINVDSEEREKTFDVVVLCTAVNVPVPDANDKAKADRLANELGINAIRLNIGDNKAISKKWSFSKFISEYFTVSPQYSVAWTGSKIGLITSEGIVVATPETVDSTWESTTLTANIQVGSETSNNRDFKINLVRQITVDGYGKDKKRIINNGENYFDEFGTYYDKTGTLLGYYNASGDLQSGLSIPNNVDGKAGKDYKKYYDQNGLIRNNYEGDLIDTKIIYSRKLIKEMGYYDILGVDYSSSQKIKDNFNLVTEIKIDDGALYDGTYLINWNSSNNEVLSVDNNGHATVTRSTNDVNVSLTPTVNFIENSIGYSASTLTLYDGESDVTYIPNYRLLGLDQSTTNALKVKVLSNSIFSETPQDRNIRIANELDYRALGITEEQFYEGLDVSDTLNLISDYSDTGVLYTNLITWSSNDTTVIENNGIIHNPSVSEGQRVVTLTATVGGTATRNFIIIVHPVLSKTQLEKEQEAIRNLTIGAIGFQEAEDEQNVHGDLSLPSSVSGVSDVTITWKSNDVSIIANDGKVTPPTTNDTYVTLTAYAGSESGATEEQRLRTFILKAIKDPVLEGPLNDADYTFITTNLLNEGLIVISETETITTLESSFSLKTTIPYKGKDVKITWEDSSGFLTINDPLNGNPATVTFTKPASTEGNANINLVAKVGNKEKIFNLIVLKQAESDSVLVERLALGNGDHPSYLSTRELGLSGKESPNSIVNEFRLQTLIPEYPQASIEWDLTNIPDGWEKTQGNEIVITPIRTAVEQVFTIDAIVKVGSEEATKTYTVTILAESQFKPAVKVGVNSRMIDRATNTKIIQLKEYEASTTERLYLIFEDEDKNPVDGASQGLIYTWEIEEDDIDTGVTIESDSIKINRQKVLDYRDSGNKDSFKVFKIFAKSDSLTTGELIIDLQIEDIPEKAEGDLIHGNSFTPKTLYLGKYAPFVTDDVHQYRTLINYGEYQLMFYTDKKPVVKYDMNGTYLGFNGESQDFVNIQIYKAIGGVDWTKLNEISGANITSRILLDPNENCVEYVNYELRNSLDEIVLRPNINSNNDSVPPEFKLISLPDFSHLSGAYNYVFARGLSNYFLVTSDEPIGLIGNSMTYPENAKFYSLVQNTWVLNDNNSIAVNGYKFDNKTSFVNALKYTSVSMPTLGIVENIDDIVYGDPNYVSYILEYSKDNEGSGYIILNSPFYGIRAIEFTETPKIEGGRIKFNPAKRSELKEKIFSQGVWVASGDSYTKFTDANGYFLREDALSSVLYSSADLLDGSKVIFNSSYRSNISIYKSINITDKLPITAPPNVSGKSVKLVGFVNGVYKCYYSEKPFRQYGNEIVLLSQDGDSQVVDVYDFTGGTWVKNNAESGIVPLNLNNNLFGKVGNNLGIDIKWTNTDVVDATAPTNVMFISLPESLKFSDYAGFLSPTLTDTDYALTYPYHILDRTRDDAYYLSRYNAIIKRDNHDLKSVANTGTIMFVPKFDNYKPVLNLTFATDKKIGEIRDLSKYDMNFNFSESEVVNDKTPPIIDAAYLYRGNLYIIGHDADPIDPTKEKISGIGANAYGFQYNTNITLPFEVSGTINGTPITYETGTNIPAGTTLWRDQYNLRLDLLNQSMSLTIHLQDKSGNKAEPKALNNLTKGMDNIILFGDEFVSDETKRLIEQENSGEFRDVDAPVIYGVYMYKDEVYVIGEDLPVGNRVASGLHQYAYGFRWIVPDGSIVRYPFKIQGIDQFGEVKIIEADENITNGFEIYNIENKQRIGRDFYDDKNSIVPTNLVIALRDVNQNIAYAGDPTGFAISEDSNNSVIWENPAYPNGIPDYIKKMLETERNKNNGGQSSETDKTPPEILSIYIYKNVLHVMARDNVKLHSIPYGFQWDTSSTVNGSVIGYKEDGTEIIMSDGENILPMTKIYKQAGEIGLNVPVLLTVIVRDANLNVTTQQVLITEGNGVIYGDVPPYIEDAINKELGDDGDDDPEKQDTEPPVITNVYTYNGRLYVEGFDSGVGLAPYAYGFNPLEDMIITTDYVGKTLEGFSVSISANHIVSQYTEIYKRENYQEIMIPMYIEVVLRDIAGNEAREQFFIRDDNTSYKGDVPDDKDGEVNPNPNDPDDGTGGDGGNVNPNPPSGGNDGGFTVSPDENMEKIDWSKYDYVVEALEKDTERVVYSIRLDKAEEIQIPRLEESTLYIIKQSAVSETDNSVLYSKKDEAMTIDTSPPVITRIYYKDNKIFIDAYDKGGLSEQPYAFVIEGARNQIENNFVEDNFKRVLPNDVLIIRVRDKAGNVSSATVTPIVSELLTNVNPTKPLMLNQGDTNSLLYWIAYFKKEFPIKGDYIIQESENLKINDGSMTIMGSGKFIIRLENVNDGSYIDILAKTLNAGSSNRTICVQLGSQTNFLLAFKDKLLEEFGTINGINWIADNNSVSRSDSMIDADKNGVGRIKAMRNGKEVIFYIAVTEDLKGFSSIFSFESDTMPYTFLVGQTFRLSTVLNATAVDIEDIDSQGEYIIFENASNGITKDGDKVTVSNIGRKSIQLLNVISDNMKTIEFEVIEPTPHIPQYNDILDSWIKPYISKVAMSGIIENPVDGRFKPENGITIKEFLVILNKFDMIRFGDLPQKKVIKNINLSKKDWDYFGTANMLIEMNENEISSIFGNGSSLNRAITRKEAMMIFSRTIFKNEYHNESNNPIFKDVNYKAPWADDINHMAGLQLVTDSVDNKFRPNDNLTRAEMIMLLYKTINYFE